LYKPNGTSFKNKKVLVFGLGLLGGGVATTNWLIKHGARVTVTDLKDDSYLELSLKRLRGNPRLKLNGHDKKDIEDNEIIVFNPDVSINNPFVKYARKLGKQIENEATIFYKLCPKPIIAVTGTRGKTTVANWIGYFLNRAKRRAVVSGNSYVEPLLKTLDGASRFEYVVNEAPSYHLEYFSRGVPAPEAAIITNLYQDHLNRHGTMRDYALAKAAILRNQSANQHLILNRDDKWTPFFIKQKPRAKIWLFSMKSLSKKECGIFYKNGWIYFQDDGIPVPVLRVEDFGKERGRHNLINLLISSLAANLVGVPWEIIQKNITSLPEIKFRQEVIYKTNKLRIINDTAATSPDGGMAAVNRFASPATILIAGGTDRQLDYSVWAKTVNKKLKPENIILLEGSATIKILRLLSRNKIEPQVFGTLAKCIQAALIKARQRGQSMILFSPAAKSFEKFKNEFDRGRQFNRIIKKLIK